jgi:hypothetical protein
MFHAFPSSYVAPTTDLRMTFELKVVASTRVINEVTDRFPALCARFRGKLGSQVCYGPLAVSTRGGSARSEVCIQPVRCSLWLSTAIFCSKRNGGGCNHNDRNDRDDCDRTATATATTTTVTTATTVVPVSPGSHDLQGWVGADTTIWADFRVSRNFCRVVIFGDRVNGSLAISTQEVEARLKVVCIQPVRCLLWLLTCYLLYQKERRRRQPRAPQRPRL